MPVLQEFPHVLGHLPVRHLRPVRRLKFRESLASLHRHVGHRRRVLHVRDLGVHRLHDERERNLDREFQLRARTGNRHALLQDVLQDLKLRILHALLHDLVLPLREALKRHLAAVLQRVADGLGVRRRSRLRVEGENEVYIAGREGEAQFGLAQPRDDIGKVRDTHHLSEVLQRLRVHVLRDERAERARLEQRDVRRPKARDRLEALLRAALPGAVEADLLGKARREARDEERLAVIQRGEARVEAVLQEIAHHSDFPSRKPLDRRLRDAGSTARAFRHALQHRRDLRGVMVEGDGKRKRRDLRHREQALLRVLRRQLSGGEDRPAEFLAQDPRLRQVLGGILGDVPQREVGQFPDPRVERPLRERAIQAEGGFRALRHARRGLDGRTAARRAASPASHQKAPQQGSRQGHAHRPTLHLHRCSLLLRLISLSFRAASVVPHECRGESHVRF